MEISLQADFRKKLYRTGRMAATFMVLMIPVQIAFYMIWPHPTDVAGWFELFDRSWMIGLISFDLIYLLSMVASIFLYIALFFALFDGKSTRSLFALVIGLVGLTIYFSSNTSLEMLALGRQYANAAAGQERDLLIASGQALYQIWKGTAYAVYYVLNGIALILFFLDMLKSTRFRKSTARIGLASGFLMLVPATAGIIGMTMSLLSLLPWTVFSVLVIQDFGLLIKAESQKSKV